MKYDLLIKGCSQDAETDEGERERKKESMRHSSQRNRQRIFLVSYSTERGLRAFLESICTLLQLALTGVVGGIAQIGDGSSFKRFHQNFVIFKKHFVH